MPVPGSKQPEPLAELVTKLTRFSPSWVAVRLGDGFVHFLMLGARSFVKDRGAGAPPSASHAQFLGYAAGQSNQRVRY